MMNIAEMRDRALAAPFDTQFRRRKWPPGMVVVVVNEVFYIKKRAGLSRHMPWQIKQADLLDNDWEEVRVDSTGPALS